jgi:hypothetical protein
MYLCRGYLKDDAYISYRYARHLADGHGMVFNLGERVEGYTNFLWVVLHAPVIGLGLDPVAWSRILGAVSALGTIVLTFLASRWSNGEMPAATNYVAPWLVASSSSVAVWSMSGMEPCLVMFFGTAAVLGLWKGLREERRSSFVWSGLAAAGAALTRPEGHLFFVVGVAAVAVVAIARRRVPPGAWSALVTFGAVVAPYHAWRVFYFGNLAPLTYHAKGSGGPEVWAMGLRQVGDLLTFNLGAIAAVLGLVSLVPRQGRGLRTIPVVLWVAFLAYVVKIGVDEMIFHRLFLPVYGAFALSAAEGVRALFRPWRPKALALAARVAAVAGLVAAVAVSIRVTVATEELHHDYRAMMESSSMELGRHVLARSAPDDVTIFQDLGAAPYAAYPLRFVDPIGVLNPFVAGELARLRINPFLRQVTAERPGGEAALAELDRAVRDHLFATGARWIGLVAYLEWRPDAAALEVRTRLNQALERRDPVTVERLLAPYLLEDRLSCGLYADPRFAERYRLAGVWRRSSAHYLALYERR